MVSELLVATNLITVVATPIVDSDRVERDGAEITEVSSGQIDNLNAKDLPTALRQIPGVTISRFSPIGSYGGAQGGSVYVRGMGTGRPGGELCTYIDGAPIESGVWGHPLMDSVPVDFTDTIAVHKNPQPGRFGGTFAAIDLQTRRRTEEGCEGEGNIAYGRYGTMLSSASAGAKEGTVDAYAGIAYKRTNGARPHSAAELENAFAHLGADLSPEDYISFTFQKTSSWVEDPSDIRTHYQKLIDKFELETEMYNVRYDASHDKVKGYSLAFFNHGDINWIKQAPEKTRWFNFGIRNRYEINVYDDLWLVPGLDVISDGGHSGKVSGRTVETSPYLGARYDWSINDDFTLVPYVGSRYSFNTKYDGEAQPEGALTLAYRDFYESTLSASRSVHYPGLYVKAMRLNDINAEEMLYFGWSNTFRFERIETSLTIYRQEINERLERTSQGYLNTGKAKSTGADVSVRYNILDSLSAFAGGAYAIPDETPVSRLPRWTFSAGSTWKICEYLKWTVDGQYIGSMYAYSVRSSAAGAEKLDDGFMFNTRLSVPVKIGETTTEFYAAVDNFTNRKFEYYPGYPMPGAMFYVGMKFKF